MFPDYGNSKKLGEVLTVDLDDLRVEGSKFEQSQRHLEAGVVLGAPEEQKYFIVVIEIVRLVLQYGISTNPNWTTWDMLWLGCGTPKSKHFQIWLIQRTAATYRC